MYRVLNLILGWDYISHKGLRNSYVRRVFTTECGNVCYWYRDRLIDIKSRKNVKWLTCKPEKFGL